jgi:hypothetical protein
MAASHGTRNRRRAVRKLSKEVRIAHMLDQTIARTTFQVGDQFSVSMTFRDGAFYAVWSPDLPGRPLTESELRDYRKGRDDFFAEVFPGKRQLVVEF